MAEIPGRAAFETAYERLAAAVDNLALAPDSLIRKIALQTLDEMRQRIEHDPAFLERLVEHVHGAASTAVSEAHGIKSPDPGPAEPLPITPPDTTA